MANNRIDSLLEESSKRIAAIGGIFTNTKPTRVLVKVTCNTGRTWKTLINGDLQSATAYLMGQLSVDECEFTGKETRHVVTKVEEVQA